MKQNYQNFIKTDRLKQPETLTPHENPWTRLELTLCIRVLTRREPQVPGFFLLSVPGSKISPSHSRYGNAPILESHRNPSLCRFDNPFIKKKHFYKRDKFPSTPKWFVHFWWWLIKLCTILVSLHWTVWGRWTAVASVHLFPVSGW